jgi:hypothetical protein
MDYKDNRDTDYSTPSAPSCSTKLNKLAAISVAGSSCPKTARSNGKKDRSRGPSGFLSSRLRLLLIGGLLVALLAEIGLGAER